MAFLMPATPMCQHGATFGVLQGSARQRRSEASGVSMMVERGKDKNQNNRGGRADRPQQMPGLPNAER